MKAITGAEDFSYFQEKVPGTYFFIGGQKQTGYGRACRQPDGSWEIVG